MKNKWLFLTALSGFFSVALGAFAAHGLQHSLSVQALNWIDTGLKYQIFHTLALMGLAVLQITLSHSDNNLKVNSAINLVAYLWVLGILFFSGSLYALAFSTEKFLVWFTPIGGILFLIGWAVLAYKAIK